MLVYSTQLLLAATKQCEAGLQLVQSAEFGTQLLQPAMAHGEMELVAVLQPCPGVIEA